jgi:hypothetical protein
MADNPSQYFTQRSRPDSIHKLVDPSHMKAEGVDDWLKHWLKLQKKKKRPLILKSPAEPNSEDPPNRSKGVNRTGKAKGAANKKGKERAVSEDQDGDIYDGENVTDVEPDKLDSETGVHPQSGDSGSHQDDSMLPPSPASAAGSKKSRITFLKSLSEDRNYRQLIRLLHAAKVCGLPIGNPCRDLLNGHVVWTNDWQACARLGQLALQRSFPPKRLPSG